MITLVPMHAEIFPTFMHEAIASYADDNVVSGRWDAQDSLARARSRLDDLLPQGLETPSHRFYEIQDDLDGQTVGYLWFAIIREDDTHHGYVYNIRIHPEFRGRGHARLALELIERMAVTEGLPSIALHVFGFNTAAQALYRSLGYGITGHNMRKALHRDDS